ncbi:MAG: BMP family ABC transporter substrate-binding protein [Bacillota bacterium]|nr:BMP family ABC transporter substrate-binding protein [Bacillota bacterium]
MKKILSTLMILMLMLTITACGSGGNGEPETYEVAMIADSADIESGSFTGAVWDSVEAFTTENSITAKHYAPESSEKEAYMKSVETAVNSGAKLVIMAGSNFETTVFSAQSLYPEVFFLLIDGVPHDVGDTYGTSANTISVIFAEEEAGYMAGYAAVKDGYKKLGFLGGEDVPAVKRYGHGFVQGAAAAAAELEQKVELRYEYTGTFEPSEDVEKKAAEWYDEGTKVIFACGGGMGASVMDAAERCSGKVIGVDVDQSALSSSVITSAQKDIDTVVTDMLKNYVSERFVGGTAFNYTAANGGVSLQIDNAKLKKFTADDYDKLLKQLVNDEIKLKKDTGVDSVKEITGEWVTIK